MESKMVFFVAQVLKSLVFSNKYLPAYGGSIQGRCETSLPMGS